MKRAALVPLAALIVVAGCGGNDDAGPAARPAAIQRVEVGQGERGAVVFRPAGTSGPLPVVIFLHGIFATNPQTYGAWVRHLVGEGNVVIYPRYQSTFTPPAAYLANAVTGIRAALRRVPVQRNTLVVAGHSAGGALSADYAAVARDLGLPPPRLVYAVYPGRGLEDVPLRIPEANAARTPADTRIVALAGDDDRTVGTDVAREVVRDATRVPRTRRTFRLVTDDRVDHHLAPLRHDAVARREFWAPLDRLIRQAR